MPDGRCGLPDALVVLEVAGAERPDREQAAAPTVEQDGREVEVALVARVPVQLNERGLDLRVAADALLAAGAEAPVHEVDEAQRQPEQVVATAGPVQRNGGLDHVAEHVQLVRPLQLGKPLLRVDALDPGLHVAAGLLHACDQRDHLVQPAVEARRPGAGDLPRHGLDDLVQV